QRPPSLVERQPGPSRDDDEIDAGGKLGLAETERLAEHSLGAVALGGPANLLAGHRDTEPRVSAPVLDAIHDDQVGRSRPPALESASKVGRAANSLVGPERGSKHDDSGPGMMNRVESVDLGSARRAQALADQSAAAYQVPDEKRADCPDRHDGDT